MRMSLVPKATVVIVIAILLIGGFAGMVQGKEMNALPKEKHGHFKDRVFNNGRIIFKIRKNGTAIIKDASSGKVLVERVYPKIEVKNGTEWEELNFKVKLKIKNWGKWHAVKIKMVHHGSPSLKVILEYRQKHRFRLYAPLYPLLKVKVDNNVEYQVTWCYEGVHLKHFEVIDNGTGYTRAPFKDGHDKQIIYNGTIDKNTTFEKGQDILIGWNNGRKKLGFNWELDKDKYKILKFISEKGRKKLNIEIPVPPSQVHQGQVQAYRPPIPDSGGGGKDSDGDGLYDAIEEGGWDVTWYDAHGHAHTEHVSSDPNLKDTDGDGLNDYEEWQKHLNPESMDSDREGLSDYAEVRGVYVSVGSSTVRVTSDPLKADTDGDGLTDFAEDNGWYIWSAGKWVTSNPRNADTDGDGLSDYKEWEMGTDPRSMDTDGDSLLDGFDEYPTIKDDEKPEMDIPHIYASEGKWWIRNLYVQDNARIATVTINYYVGNVIKDIWSQNIYASHAWINASVRDDIWDYVAGNKIEIIVMDVNGNTVKYTYSHDLYSDLKELWDKISKFVSGAITNAVKALIAEYPELATFIALAWALGESLWSNSIGGLIDIVKNPMQFVNGIKTFINALKSNGVMNTISAILGGIKEEIEQKVNTLVSYIPDISKRNEIKQQCFEMFVVGEIIGFVVAMALQPGGFAEDLGSFIEKIGTNAEKLAEAFGKIANTIEKMKNLLQDVKSLTLGKLMEKSAALKNTVKELVQAGKMSEKIKNAMNKVARLFGKNGVMEEEELVEDIGRELENGARGEDIEDALDDIRSDSRIAGKPEKEKELLEAEENAIKEAGLTGEKAKIFHEVLRRRLVSEADKTDAEFLKKVAEYIKHWDGNPLDAEKHTVVRFLKVEGVNTEVSGHTIENFAVLKMGEHYGPHEGFGWKHIWEEELRTKRFYTYYGGKYSGEALQRKILEDIENALRYGKKIYEDKDIIRIKWGDIEVRVSKKYPGSIQTAIPNT